MNQQDQFDEIPEWEGTPHEPDIPIKDYPSLSRQQRAHYRLLIEEEDMIKKAQSAEIRTKEHRRGLRNLKIKQAAAVVLAVCTLSTIGVSVTGHIQEANAEKATLEQLNQVPLNQRMPLNMPSELIAYVEGNSTLTLGEFNAMFDDYVTSLINQDPDNFYYLAHALEVTPSENTQHMAAGYSGFMNQKGHVSDLFKIAAETQAAVFKNTTSDDHMLQLLRAGFYQAIVDDSNLVGVTEEDVHQTGDLHSVFIKGNSYGTSVADFEFAKANQLTDEKTYQIIQQMQIDAEQQLTGRNQVR